MSFLLGGKDSLVTVCSICARCACKRLESVVTVGRLRAVEGEV